MSARDVNRRWLLARRPTGNVLPDDFAYHEEPVPDAGALRSGELLLRNRAFLCAPTMRNWMDPPSNSLYPSIPIGAVVMAPAVAEVVASARPDVPAGARVTTHSSWQDYVVVPDGHAVINVDPAISDIDALGVYGLNARTAYFGLIEVGRPVAGETLVVSGAAGSTGSMAAQIGKILGCRVIGIAGGPDKCAWLTDTLGLDGAIDYRNEDVEARIRAKCPGGVDIFYDNVGGAMLQAAVENMAKFGRIVLCGQIAGYTRSAPVPGPTNMMRLIYGSIRMQGFLQGDYAPRADEAIAQLQEWVAAGRIAHREDARSGFQDIPQTFAALFNGANDGTLIALLD